VSATTELQVGDEVKVRDHRHTRGDTIKPGTEGKIVGTKTLQGYHPLYYVDFADGTGEWPYNDYELEKIEHRNN
jgi:hypothetical protein